jgi:hypothetical protein
MYETPGHDVHVESPCAVKHSLHPTIRIMCILPLASKTLRSRFAPANLPPINRPQVAQKSPASLGAVRTPLSSRRDPAPGITTRSAGCCAAHPSPTPERSALPRERVRSVARMRTGPWRCQVRLFLRTGRLWTGCSVCQDATISDGASAPKCRYRRCRHGVGR